MANEREREQRGEKSPFYLDGGLTAGPLLLTGSPGILAESCSRTLSLFPEPVVVLEDFAAVPLLLPAGLELQHPNIPGLPSVELPDSRVLLL